ncbi:MAG: leucyl aminopeptidase family protein [Candidatus Liptonbacteria bacterium]|nr:leucyl aminopeptidase family protein [Candidatus Liptonbacteria bacterium]
MKFQLVKNISKTTAPVFILKDEDRIDRHGFFKFLSDGDRKYLVNFQKNFPIKKEHSHPLVLPSGVKVMVIGVWERAKFNHRKAMMTARRVIAVARRERVRNLAVSFEDFLAKDNRDNRKTLAEVLATQMEMANYEFVKYKTPQPEGWAFVQEVGVVSEKPMPILNEALKQGQIVGEEINNARTLSNTPGNDMTPQTLANGALKIGEQYKVKVEILDEKAMKELKMGGVLGVAKGSMEKPKFIVMEYMKGKRSEKPVVLVGKGVTFDTGGLNLKPENGIYEMHMDMSGGAAVIHTIAALARLKVKKNIVALVPAVENMPSGSSYHPGDVLTTMNGKTIEVLNTDAEGRVILADALEYSKKYKPRLVIDVATLTGSAISALGQRASAIFSNNARVEQKMIESGEAVGDFLWALPLWEEYEEDVKGTFGDVANSSKTRYGGVINGAMFLWQFIKSSQETRDKGHGGEKDQIPWVHIDMAPRMTATENEFLAKGSTGAPVGLLTEFLKKF